jgi:ABC-2 type transport system ATP-binding protein
MNMVIEIKNLTKCYLGRKVQAVKNLHLEVKKGEIFGFLGPNGAGKTTTIRCMMDFVRPTSGEINILGLNSRKDSVELKSKIGYLSDTAHFYSHWTASNHIAFQQSLRGKSPILTNLVKIFDLNFKQNFGNLSSGNKRKLGVILALMNEPEVLILDEPTSALDPLLQNALLNYLRDFAAAGGTVFISSHNLAEVEKICDRVAIIRDGKIVATESITDLKRMKMYDVSFHTEDFNIKAFEAENIELISNIDGLVKLKIKGDINPIITKLARITIKDLEITHVSLEDIFLEFYKK